MSSLVIDERTALEDLVESCYGAIYAYGIVAAYLTDPDSALDAMAEFRKQRDQLLATIGDAGYAAPPARAAYTLTTQVSDDASARVTASLLEENIVAHWANAIFYLPLQIQQRECEFLQSSAIRSFNWAGIAKAFSSAQ
jgi:hypothetical protein